MNPLHSLHPRRRRWPAWLALWAMLAMALLPGVSHALAWAQGGHTQWAEVCTAQGLRLVAVADAAGTQAPALPAAHAQLEHCLFCAGGLGPAALPPAWAPAAPASTAARARPAGCGASPHAGALPRHAAPRGPPPAA